MREQTKIKIDKAVSVSDGILFHYYWHFRSGPEQTAIVHRLSTRNLTIRKCGWCSHHTREQRRMLNVDELFSVSYMLFLKDVFIGILPTVSLKKQASEQVKKNTWQELNVSSSLSTAEDFMHDFKVLYFAQLCFSNLCSPMFFPQCVFVVFK